MNLLNNPFDDESRDKDRGRRNYCRRNRRGDFSPIAPRRRLRAVRPPEPDPGFENCYRALEEERGWYEQM